LALYVSLTLVQYPIYEFVFVRPFFRHEGLFLDQKWG
jgi:hypothetical protein